MYRCIVCGHLFEEGEQATWREDRGEFWGSPCNENVSGCPLCKGDYEEIKPCKICGSYKHEADKKYCVDCMIDVKIRFQTFVANEFTVKERELLNELYEGEEI
jgi:hypothetical protein